jgi:predicted Zn-dependent protease
MRLKSIRFFGRWPALLAACGFFAGCTVNPHLNRDMLAAPTTLSDAYTQVNLRLKLATTMELQESSCGQSGCMESAQFDERVARIGAKLVEAAYENYPGLAERVPAFEFSVMDKSEPGTGSTAGGVVVVLRPVAAIAHSDEALSFVLAREIGHVVAQHHEENTATSLVVSLIAAVIAPVAQVVKMLATVYSGATTIAASASVTAASFASSKALIASYRPRQLDEADKIALKLLTSSGLATRDLASGFALAALQASEDQWVVDLRKSVLALGTPAPSATIPAVGAIAPARPTL